MVSPPQFQVVFVNIVGLEQFRTISPGSPVYMANNNMGIRLFQQNSMFFYSRAPKNLVHTPYFLSLPSKSEGRGEDLNFRWIRYQFYI